MPKDRDVQAFDQRASQYEDGWRGRLHHEISDRVVELALTHAPAPQRILDVGSGTGYVLRQLAGRLPDAEALTGIDPAPGMVQAAAAAAPDRRLSFSVGTAEHLPFADGAFDLVVSTTSFDHWRDQQAGLAECARVLRPGGQLVLTDQFSAWLWPTLVTSRRGKARTRARADRLLLRAGFAAPQWHRLYAVIIAAATATRQAPPDGGLSP